MAVYVVSLLLALLIGWDLAKPLKNHPGYFYAAALVVDLFTVACGMLGLRNPVTDFLCSMLGTGSLAFFLFCIVMFTGCFKVGSKPRIRLKQVRQPLALTAAILACGHIGYVFISHVVEPGSLGIAFGVISYAVAFLLAILGITSVLKIQDILDDGKLGIIHKLAYPFFVLLCIHAAWIYVFYGQWLVAAMYAGIGVLYVALRIRFALK